MKLTYDSKLNIGYIKMRDKVGQVDTLRVSDEMNIDISPDGKIYGIELLNANEQLKHKDKMNFVIVNEELNQRHELPI